KDGSMECRESRDYDNKYEHCDIREQTLPAGGLITVDGRQNGGISIKAWDRAEILARAKVQTRAPSQAEADQLAQQVRIETAVLNIHAVGPDRRDQYEWSVRYEVFVPRHSDDAGQLFGASGNSDCEWQRKFTVSAECAAD